MSPRQSESDNNWKDKRTSMSPFFTAKIEPTKYRLACANPWKRNTLEVVWCCMMSLYKAQRHPSICKAKKVDATYPNFRWFLLLILEVKIVLQVESIKASSVRVEIFLRKHRNIHSTTYCNEPDKIHATPAAKCNPNTQSIPGRLGFCSSLG